MEGIEQSPVSFDVSWFLWFNKVLVAYSFTLVVHINCLYNAALLVWRHPKERMFTLSLIQNMCAVACHLSRVTDYFFVTDCAAKPFHNYTQYWLSICAMDLIVIWRDLRVFEMLFALAPITRAMAWGLLGLIPFLCKSVAMLLTISSLKGSTGKFAICHLDLVDAYFAYSHWCWIAYHVGMLSIHSSLLLDLKHYITLPFQRHPRPSPHADRGTLLLLTSDLTTIAFLLLILQGNLALGGPDLALQTMWAIKSKCVVEMLNRIKFKDALPQPTSYPSSINSSSNIHSLKTLALPSGRPEDPVPSFKE